MKSFSLHEKEFWILIVAGVALFYRPLLLGETLFFRDLYLHFYPQKLRFVELVRGGQFPLWDPFLHGGQPFLADLNNMALYPFNLLYLILPPVFCLNLDIIFHVLLCAAAAYWLARSLGISPLSSMAVGAIYAFCGYTLSLTNLLSRLTAMPYLPLMAVTLHGFFRSGHKRSFVLCVLFGVLQFLAGAPEMTLLTFITLLGWTFFSDMPVPGRKRLAVYVFLALLVAGISAVQIIPTAEMVQQSVRSSHSDYDSFSAWSLNVKRIPEMFVPGFMGFTNRVSRNAYWGSNFESMGFPFILSIYFGWFALSLAILGGARKNKFRLFLGGLAIFALLVSIGRQLPGFRSFYESVPLAGVVRYPVKVLAVGILPVALLAGFGLDSILRSDIRKTRVAMYFWISAVIFGAIGLLFGILPGFGQSFVEWYFGQSSGTAGDAIRNAITHTALFSLCVALIYQYWIVKPGSLQHAGLVALILFDLLLNASTVNHFAPGEFFTSEPQLVKTVKRNLNDGRFYRSPNPLNLVVKLPSNDAIFMSRWNLETLQNYAATMYSIPIIYHDDFDNLAKKEIVRISDHLLHASWEQRLRFLPAAGVSLFMTGDRLTSASLTLVSTIRNSSDRPFFLYGMPGFNGIAFFPANVTAVRSQEEAFKQIDTGMGDTSNTVFVLNPEKSFANDPEKCPPGQAQILEMKANRYSVRTRSECDSLLYFAQPYYDGWITRIDGTDAQSLRANYAFSATFVTAGEHKVERIYRPRSVMIGLLISLSSLAALLIWFFVVRKPV